MVKHNTKFDESDFDDVGLEMPEHLKKKIKKNKKVEVSENYENIESTPVKVKHLPSPNNRGGEVGKLINNGEAGSIPTNNVSMPMIDDDGGMDLNKLFSSELGNDSDVLKELFSSDNIKVKTDLTPEQISIISRLELQAKITQNFYLTAIIKELETLLVSKNRLSRQEFVNSFHGIKEQEQSSTIFSKIGNIFKNDKV